MVYLMLGIEFALHLDGICDDLIGIIIGRDVDGIIDGPLGVEVDAMANSNAFGICDGMLNIGKDVDKLVF